MQRPELKLVRPGAAGAPRRQQIAALGLAAVALSCAVAATLLGADRPRWEPTSTEVARGLVPVVLERGSEDPEVREAMREFRRRVGRSPLDARTRALYAGLLLELTSSRDDARASVFHARRAAELAPVTVPVVRTTATVLARCGEKAGAAELIRVMFEYEPEGAARLLGALEPFLPPESLEPGGDNAAIADIATAWMAWSAELASRGRGEQAEAWLEATYRRWPDHLPALEALASRAVHRGQWEAVDRLLPPDGSLPATPEAAALFAYRARSAAQRGAEEPAARDIEQAITLAGGTPRVLLLTGDVRLACGDVAEARRLYRTALFSIDDPQRRSELLIRLARLEDEQGRPADALRAWRAVQELDPEHLESRTRIDELTGFQR